MRSTDTSRELVSPGDLRRIVCDPTSGELLVGTAERVAERLVAEKLKANQIRKIFDEVRQIGGMLTQKRFGPAREKIYRLDYIMRYQAARHAGGVLTLVNVLAPAAKLVVEPRNDDQLRDRFQRFADFLEAVLAYHKAKGGGEK